MFSNSHGSGINADKVAPSKLSSKLKNQRANEDFQFYLISTEGAFRRPMNYEQYHPSHPVHHIALNELNRPKIDLSRPSMT